MKSTPIRDRTAAFRAMCRRRGWRLTAQRRMVFQCVDGRRDHPCVETVWRQVRRALPEVSLDSVYRILDEFAAAGWLRRLEHGRILRYDADAAPHHHFECSGCGRLFDFECPELGPVAGACAPFAAGPALRVIVYGRCRACGPEPEGTGTAAPSDIAGEG